MVDPLPRRTPGDFGASRIAPGTGTTSGRDRSRTLSYGATTAGRSGDVDSLLERYGIDVGIWELDLAGRRFRASGSWARMIGSDPGALGDSLDEWLGRVDAAHRPLLELALQTHIEGLSSEFEAEYAIHHRDGSWRRMRARGHMERHPDGTPAWLAGHQEDITERRQQESELRRSEGRFRGLVEGCPDAILVHREGRVVQANRQLAEMVGLAEGELPGMLVLQLVAPEDRAFFSDDVRRLSRGEAAAAPAREVRLSRRDGSTVTAELSSLRLHFDGAPAIMVVARDVSARKQQQAQLAHTERMATVGVLAAGMAHEINNPLMAVGANLQLLVEDVPRLAERAAELRRSLVEALGESRANALAARAGALLDPEALGELVGQLQDAHEGSLRVRSIVANLKHFAHTEEQPQPVAPRRVIEIAKKLAMHEIRHRARFVERLDDVPPVLGDEGRLSQVILNLLLNAAQAIPSGAASDNEVRVVVRRDGDGVAIEVVDTGAGIAPEALNRIFEPFYTTKPPGIGSGLGLAICRHIVEGHRGRIEAESQLGKGTTMRVWLPPAAEALRPVEAAAPAGKEASQRVATHERVLVVDDEPAVCRALARALRDDFEVVTAAGGAEAIRVLERDPDFALILCDLMMGDVSGQDVHGWLQVRRPALARRLVFVTGGVSQPGVQAYLDRIDNLVVEKPVDCAKLRRLLRRLVEGPSESAPSAAGTVDRRAARRVAGDGLSGTLAAAGASGEIDVIDFSACGLRVAARGLPVVLDAGRDAALALRGGDGTVGAQVQLVRTVRTDAGTDLCFRILSMDPASDRRYRGWIAER